MDVDEEHGRRLWYYFATSQRSPENDPLVSGGEQSKSQHTEVLAATLSTLPAAWAS